jgi:putative acetyltransferase
MRIRRARPTDRETLLDIWLRSVHVTHAFLSPDDIRTLTPQVREYLASDATEFWVACGESGEIMGFMGLAGNEMESLFLAPEHQRRGTGRRLVQHARSLRGDLTVEVNEQNTGARRFYEACGFVVAGRTETDRQGRSFPLLQLRSSRSGREPEAQES